MSIAVKCRRTLTEAFDPSWVTSSISTNPGGCRPIHPRSGWGYRTLAGNRAWCGTCRDDESGAFALELADVGGSTNPHRQLGPDISNAESHVPAHHRGRQLAGRGLQHRQAGDQPRQQIRPAGPPGAVWGSSRSALHAARPSLSRAFRPVESTTSFRIRVLPPARHTCMPGLRAS
jgi:hypothetical protein